MVRGSRGRHNYIDGQLQKRSRYYIFRDWANTPDAVLAEAGPRRKVVATAPGQCLDAWQWRQPRESRAVHDSSLRAQARERMLRQHPVPLSGLGGAILAWGWQAQR